MTGTAASETDTTDESSETSAETTADKPEVDWKARAREWEKRAKANADAATQLAALEESQKSESQKLSDAKVAAEKDAAEARAEALRWRVAAKHGISDEDAELFLTGTDEETLKKQAERLADRSPDRKKPNVVPREGTTNSKPGQDEVREFTRAVFGRADE